MFSGESSCPGDSEYVWQRGVEGILGRVTGSPSLPHFPKNKRILAVKKKSHSHNNQNWALKHKSLLAIDYGKTWFKFVSSNLKIVVVVLFFTAHIFANGPHFVALSKLRAAKTRSNKFFSTAHNFANGLHFVALTQLRATETGSKKIFKKVVKIFFRMLSA